MADDEETRVCLASDEEALRLVVAFYCIMEPDKRDEVLGMAQRYAAAPRDVEAAIQRPLSGHH